MFEGKQLHAAVDKAERQAAGLRPRLAAANRMLTALGHEVCDVVVIALALLILVAPLGIGLAATWGAWAGIVELTGSRLLGLITGAAVFAFLCRYVWGARLQSAAKRAAAALVSAPR